MDPIPSAAGHNAAVDVFSMVENELREVILTGLESLLSTLELFIKEDPLFEDELRERASELSGYASQVQRLRSETFRTHQPNYMLRYTDLYMHLICLPSVAPRMYEFVLEEEAYLHLQDIRAGITAVKKISQSISEAYNGSYTRQVQRASTATQGLRSNMIWLQISGEITRCLKERAEWVKRQLQILRFDTKPIDPTLRRVKRTDYVHAHPNKKEDHTPRSYPLRWKLYGPEDLLSTSSSSLSNQDASNSLFSSSDIDSLSLACTEIETQLPPNPFTQRLIVTRGNFEVLLREREIWIEAGTEYVIATYRAILYRLGVYSRN